MQSLPAAGGVVVIRHQRWRVDRAFRYGSIVEIDAGGTTFFAPFDRIVTATRRLRPRRVRRQRWHARIAHARATAESYELPLAALTAAIDLHSHQIEPWLAFASGARRLLIADDVGLGKTIEAGLIVAEAIRRSLARRVLILAPSTLAGQWQRELLDRFVVAAAIADAESLRQLALDLPRDVNPWSVDGVFLTSIDFVKQPHVLAAMPDHPWDIVIIDEAHMLCGDSERHDAAHEIAQRALRVLLLTATPHSGDETAARRLHDLGALGSGDEDSLVVFRRMRLDIGSAPLRRIRRVRVTLSPAETQTLDLLSKFSGAARDAASGDTRETTELLLAILGKRALSTFGALVLTIDRRLAFLDAPEPLADADQLSLSFGDGDDPAISVRIGLQAGRERNWLRRLRAVASTASAIESKIARLRALIARTDDAVIVFTEFRDSLAIVARGVSDFSSVTIAHGGLTPAQLGDAIAAFQSGRSRVLIATDVASQGLNLQQRCRWVIHLDRPWNPVRLEQRTGRVDRLGQVRDVHVTELQTSHDREFELAARVGRRAQAAATSAWLRPCVLWARRAQAAARVLHARRRLAAEWRGPAGDGRPVATRRKTTSGVVFGHAPKRTPDVVFLYRTDIRDRDGQLREQVLSRRVAARLRRLARLEGERAARRWPARRWQELTQLNLPGSGLELTANNVRTQVRAENAESAEKDTLLVASESRLIAFEID